MLSLDEDFNELLPVINSKSAKSIISFLSKKKEATESEIADKLKIPLSTVHYNITKLKEAGLIGSDRYHYSKKGKKIEHYSLNKKAFLIVPTKNNGFSDFVKHLVPIFLAFGIVSLILAIYGFLANAPATSLMKQEAEGMMMKSAEFVQISVNQPPFWKYAILGALIEIIVITGIFAILYLMKKKDF
ncbi:MAG: Helix-turn-helix domain [Candidatus Woesearchaeota archaeon]|nr:Helix-turn-helix domain [Candidatus Woesearchaeota archaeon]